MAELAWGAGTDPGQLRPQNEDFLHASNGIYVVADGMGGHEAGEIASALAVERIRDVLITDGDAPSAEQVVEAISDANGDIFRAAIANPGQAGMGTTVTAIAVIADPMAGRGEPNIDDNDGLDLDKTTPIVPREQPEALVLANVGDSRTYLYRHGRLRRVTVDHSYVQELVNTGHITNDEARTHPQRNIITRALGIEPDVKVDWWTLPLVRGDRFVLCSDGLVDEVSDAEISQVLTDQSNPQKAVDQLISMANDAGGRDNITIIIVDVLEGEPPPDPTQELDLSPVWANDPTVSAADLARIEAGDLELAGDDTADTEDDDTDDKKADGESATPPSKRSRLARSIALFAVLALIVLGFVVFGTWARGGYFVDFDSNDQVTVYKGRPGGVLWFEPTVENPVDLQRDELVEADQTAVELQPEFDEPNEAINYAVGLERVTRQPADLPETDPRPTTTTTTTTSTTTTTTTTAPRSATDDGPNRSVPDDTAAP